MCHSCFDNFPALMGIGRYLGVTFNFLFLILSAFLLGSSWNNKGCPKLSFEYVGKRVAKLSKSYYPYLIVLFLFLYFSQDYFNWRNLMTHTLYLPWFDKIDGFGHLWFMTMIVLCYISIWVLSNLSKWAYRPNSLIYGALIGGGIDWCLTDIGLPGYMFPYLVGYLFVFTYSNRILEVISKCSISALLAQFLVINTIVIWSFYNSLYEKSPFISYLIGMISASSIFCTFYVLFKNTSRIKFIEWLSGISFEIYLVHEFFLGRFSIYRLVDNALLGFMTLFSSNLYKASKMHLYTTLIIFVY